MTTNSEIETGYHIRVRHIPWSVIVIHAPTENWQHRPREIQPKDGFWVGPFLSLERAEQVAKKLAEQHGSPVEMCRTCFRYEHPPPPTDRDHVRGKRGIRRDKQQKWRERYRRGA